MKEIQEFLDEAIWEARANPYRWCPEMGKVSRPVLEIMEGAVLVVDRKGMAAVAKSPIKAGVCSSERAEGEGIPGFFRGLRDDFCVRDEGGCVLLGCKNVCVGDAVGHLSGISR